jgi:hypothetical protein
MGNQSSLPSAKFQQQVGKLLDARQRVGVLLLQRLLLQLQRPQVDDAQPYVERYAYFTCQGNGPSTLGTTFVIFISSIANF